MAKTETSKQFFRKGELIIEEGSVGTCAYIIDRGAVEVSTIVKNAKCALAKLEKNQIFGEMGLIEDKPRSASIVALEDTELRVITRESFKTLFAKDPNVILPIVRALFERLRTSSKMPTITTCNVCGAKLSAKQGDEPKIEQNIKQSNAPTITDERYVTLEGTNDLSKEQLGYKMLEVKEFPFRIGRYTPQTGLQMVDVLINNDLYIREENPPFYVSKNHFMIDKADGNLVVVDRGSNSGFVINDELVKDSYILSEPENEIIVGSSFSPFVFKITIKGEIKRPGEISPQSGVVEMPKSYTVVE